MQFNVSDKFIDIEIFRNFETRVIESTLLHDIQ